MSRRENAVDRHTAERPAAALVELSIRERGRAGPPTHLLLNLDGADDHDDYGQHMYRPAQYGHPASGQRPCQPVCCVGCCAGCCAGCAPPGHREAWRCGPTAALPHRGWIPGVTAWRSTAPSTDFPPWRRWPNRCWPTPRRSVPPRMGCRCGAPTRRAARRVVGRARVGSSPKPKRCLRDRTPACRHHPRRPTAAAPRRVCGLQCRGELQQGLPERPGHRPVERPSLLGQPIPLLRYATTYWLLGTRRRRFATTKAARWLALRRVGWPWPSAIRCGAIQTWRSSRWTARHEPAQMPGEHGAPASERVPAAYSW
jgi:hypothetical protein